MTLYTENYNEYTHGRCVGLIKCSVHLIRSILLKAISAEGTCEIENGGVWL